MTTMYRCCPRSSAASELAMIAAAARAKKWEEGSQPFDIGTLVISNNW
jgi:hypothetical protein